MISQPVEGLLRELAPRVLAGLVRRHGGFTDCEEAVQEALLAAAVRWPAEGLPRNPQGWLASVAWRRLVETWRSDAARRRREEKAFRLEGSPRATGAAEDDSLTLLMLCCHPSLTPASQVALTLRAVGGLTTAEIGRAFLVPEATMGQRISRAKERIRESGAKFHLPPPEQRAERLTAVLHVLYLVFNEGYTASAGDALMRVELSAEAIRLVRQLYERLPAEGEVAGLLALMLLTDARRHARIDAAGNLVPLREQDRGRWNRALIEEGVAIITEALRTRPIGPYQLQAAIAAVHDEAPTHAETDWPQILRLYDMLRLLSPSPMVQLNRIVALAMVEGPAAGLSALEADPSLLDHHRVDAVRAHLLEMAGDRDGARDAYERAALRTLSLPERNYLRSQASRAR